MSLIPCRVLPFLDAPGPRQMALDHALLDSVDRDPRFAVFRTYSWNEPTLSLGYFQEIEEAEREGRFADVAIVRRLTGGGAIWHDRDLTYALIVPRTLEVARRASDLYRAVHGAIADSLASLGVNVQPRGKDARDQENRPFLCFLDRDPEDLVFGGSKVVGSAQRRRPAAVLQHGSILLRRSPTVPELPGLVELAGFERSESGVFPESFFRSLGLDPRPSRLSEEEEREAGRLEGEVYRDSAWTRKR
ncbi:MAG TPA: lipoate--protein ligase [Isosphaeraceae bacterium]|nr:lipoate--protein ligase [Isosphaeraceae bacterium]